MAISECVRSGNQYVKDRMLQWIAATHAEDWDDKFAKNLADLTDPDDPELYLPDGRPLLGKFVARPNPVGEEEDDIPF